MVMETKNFSAARIEEITAGIATGLGLSQTE